VVSSHQPLGQLVKQVKFEANKTELETQAEQLVEEPEHSVQAPSQASHVFVAVFPNSLTGHVDPQVVPERKKLVLQAVQGLGLFAQMEQEESHWRHLFKMVSSYHPSGQLERQELLDTKRTELAIQAEQFVVEPEHSVQAPSQESQVHVAEFANVPVEQELGHAEPYK
jgi:hypothetical protein